MTALNRPQLFAATVSHRDTLGQEHEESFPVRAAGREMACEMALQYVLEVLKLKEFKLRVVGA